ncbi:MAG: SET domain-containing protein [Bacteroidia bacterium]
MLYVKKSTLPDAGKGLYTKEFIKKGKRIVEYTGEIISYKEYDERVQKNRYGYLFYFNKNRCIDAYNHPEALARYANDAKGIKTKKGLLNNSTYRIVGTKCYIYSFKNIPPGAEIFVGYGAEYWRDIRHNKRLEAREKKKKSLKSKV